MSKAENRFMQNITSLPAQIIPSVHKVVCWVITFLVLVVAAGLYFTPWIQTAHGSGAADSRPHPPERTTALPMSESDGRVARNQGFWNTSAQSGQLPDH